MSLGLDEIIANGLMQKFKDVVRKELCQACRMLLAMECKNGSAHPTGICNGRFLQKIAHSHKLIWSTRPHEQNGTMRSWFLILFISNTNVYLENWLPGEIGLLSWCQGVKGIMQVSRCFTIIL